MGTFHDDKGELHGITVVVDTTDSRVFVGRCDTVAPEGVILLDADVHDEAEGTPKDEWVKKAAMVGVFPKLPHVLVPTAEVASVTRLGDL